MMIATMCMILVETAIGSSSFRRRDKRGNILMEKRQTIAHVNTGSYISVGASRTFPANYYKEVIGTWIPKKHLPNPDKGHFLLYHDQPGDEVDIPIVEASAENLQYYGCELIGGLRAKHASKLSTYDYKRNYHENFVLENYGGSGLERHDFEHTEKPLWKYGKNGRGCRPGYLLLGKIVNQEEKFITVHLSAFQIAQGSVVKIPGGTIHSNDHMIGTWETLVQDQPNPAVDDVTCFDGISLKPLKFRFRSPGPSEPPSEDEDEWWMHAQELVLTEQAKRAFYRREMRWKNSNGALTELQKLCYDYFHDCVRRIYLLKAGEEVEEVRYNGRKLVWDDQEDEQEFKQLTYRIERELFHEIRVVSNLMGLHGERDDWTNNQVFCTETEDDDIDDYDNLRPTWEVYESDSD
jgi:hypothetical protein